MSEIKAKLFDWMIHGEVGASSYAMAGCFAGMPCGTAYPLDPDDLRRCVLLLDAVPEARERMGDLRKLSPMWSAMVDNWDALEASLRAEASRQGADIKDRYARWSAAVTYRMMQEIEKKARYE